MPADWRDASPDYITYASSPHMKEAPHAYLSLDAVVNLNYEVGEFGRSINETPPRSSFARNRRVRRVVEVESSSSSSSSSSSLGDDLGEGNGGEDFENLDASTNELSEYLASDSLGNDGDGDECDGGKMGAGDEMASRYEGSINETVIEAMDEAIDDLDFADGDSSMKGGGGDEKREERGVRAGEDAMQQALGEASLKDLLVEVEGESGERVNRFERS